MEQAGSLPHSQEPATCPYPWSLQSMPHHFTSWLILILSCHLRLSMSSKWSPSLRCPHQYICVCVCVYIYTHTHTHTAPLRATCPALLILGLNTRVASGEAYVSLSFSLCSVLHSLAALSHLGPNILLNTLFSIPSDYFPPPVGRPSSTPVTKQQAKL